MEDQVTLDVLNENTGFVERHALEFEGEECLLQLKSIPGATALQVLIRSANSVTLLAEIPACEESLRLKLRRMPDRPPRLECGLRHITYLEPSEDSPLVFVPTQSGQTDILFLIDATTLHPSPGEASGVGSLFALDEWTNLSQRLASLPEQISAAGASIRTAVTAFGDFDARLLSAPEVRLLLHPADLESRLLRNFDAGELLAELRRIPVPAPDGDYIDALAEGLESCLHAGWRDDARKLVVVFGDSAGYSAVEEQSSAMQWANARFRALDVYDQAAQLHRRNIELASIFHDPGANALKEAHTAAYELIRASRKQFQRLASLPGWAFTTESLASDQIPLAWSSACHPLGRGACPGILLN